jgi:malonyl CoA-acyl carrier protein transacylase/acyl carrier protein
VQSFSLFYLAARSQSELSVAVQTVRLGSRPIACPGAQVRLAIVYAGPADLRDKLEQVDAALSGQTPLSALRSASDFYYCSDNIPARLAFLYPGQGSQRVGMLGGLRAALPYFEDNLKRLDGLWTSLTNESLVPLIYPSADNSDMETTLRRTSNAQPVLGLVSTALRLSLEGLGIRATMHAGHSYGELPALCAAGYFDERVLFRLSRERGKLLEAAGKEASGAMIAIAAGVTEAEAFCRHAAVELEIVNLNAPRQVVAAGTTDAVARLEALASEAGLPVKRLNTACAFHSSLMAPARYMWRRFIEHEFEPVVGASRRAAATAWSNVSGRPYPDSMEDVRELLTQQIVSPVYWSGICEDLQDAGANIFIEVGAGRTLSDLMMKNLKPGQDTLIQPADPGHDDACKHTVQLIARLAVRGVDVDWARFCDASAFQTEVPLAAAPAAAGGTLLQTLFDSNQAVLERYLVQQSTLVELFTHNSSEIERVKMVQSALQANQRVVEALLAANETAFRALLTGDNPTAAMQQKVPALSPPDGTVPDQAVSNDVDLPSKVVAAVRAEISRTTGFRPESISASTSFNDLGLDSLSVAEIWSRVLDRVPGLEAHAEHFLAIHSLADITRLFKQRESNNGAAVDTGDWPTRWKDLQRYLMEKFAGLKNVQPSEILADADFERDLQIDVFTRERVIQECLASYPEFHQAGRELLNATTLEELEAILSRIHRGNPAIERFVLAERPAIADAPTNIPSRVLVVGHRSKSVDRVCAVLRNNGIQIDLADCKTTPSSLPSTVIFVSQPALDLNEALDRSVTTLFRLAKGVLENHSILPGLQLIVLAPEGATPLAGGAVGLARSLARELSGVTIRAIALSSDLTGVDERLLIDAMFREREEPVVEEFQGRLRYSTLVRERRSRNASDTFSRVNSSSRILVLGGGGGVSAEISIAIAREYGCSIAAIGRTPWPDTMPYPEVEAGIDEEAAIKQILTAGHGNLPFELLQQQWRLIAKQRTLWRTKERVEAAGGRFTYEQGDAADAESLRNAIGMILAGGNLHGAIHGAGAVNYNLLAAKPVDEFLSVVRTKAIPALLLREILTDQPLEFVFMLSSIISFTGAAGQSDYAAGNEILNVAAREWNRQVPYPVKSLLWSFWSETGLAPGYFKAHAEWLGIPGIPTREGVQFLLDELRHGSKNEAWVLFAPPKALQVSMDVPTVMPSAQAMPQSRRLT